MAEPKSWDEVWEIIQQISFMDRVFVLLKKGDGFLFQISYMEQDVERKGAATLQKARKWYISPYSTETEIVETVFKACRTSMDHVVKEHFLYAGHRIYSPHIDVLARVEICQLRKFDRRD